MKVLVTGGAGYIGSWLVPELLAKNLEVSVIDSLSFNQTTLLPFFSNRNFSFTLGDIRDESLMKKLVDEADIIIHLAGIVGEPICRVEPDLAESVNSKASIILNKLRGRKPIIFSSTGSNYGKVTGVCTEETPSNPLSIYAKTKLDGEKAFLETGNVVVYRFATGFGVSPRMRLDLLPNDFCHQAVTSGSLIIYQKNALRTFIHVRDMARAITFAVENFHSMKDNLYNVGHESLSATKEMLAQNIQKYLPKFYVHFAEIGYDPDERNYEVSYAKVRRAGFDTKISLDEGIAEMVKALPTIKFYNPYTSFL